MSDVEQLAPKDEVQQEVQQSAETTHFGFKTVAKEENSNWSQMCFTRWQANMT